MNIAHSMEQGLPEKLRLIPRILYNPKINNHVHKITPLLSVIFRFRNDSETVITLHILNIFW
jgi:hypothetical protein